MIGAILAGVSTLSSLYGSIKSAQANNKQDQALKARDSELESWYNKEYNQDYLDKSEARGTLKILRDNNKETMKKASQNNAIKGASDEASVATADNINKDYSNKVAQIASYGTQDKDNIRREYIGQKMNLDNLQAQNLAQKSENWSNFMGNAANAGMGAIEADGNGAFDKADAGIKKLWAGAKDKRIRAANGIGNNVVNVLKK